jgi:uncharacterized protein
MRLRRADARRDATPESPTFAAPYRWLTRATITVLAAAMVFAGAGAARAQRDSSAAAPQIPAPVGFVNDRAGLMSEPTRARLEAFLDQVKQKTGAEFAVLTVQTTAPMTPDEYKVQVFQQWGIGKKGEDNGLLMLVARDERELKFETGYGLEGTLPDGLESRIFRDEMAPRFRAGDFEGGIVAGVLECSKRIAAEKGVTLEWDGRELRYDRPSRRANAPIGLFLFIGFIILMSILRGIGGGGGGRRRRWGGGWYMGPGGFGGWGGGFGGGGFGGGGFGGGGSFGGFGGGASGGGGGGGKW